MNLPPKPTPPQLNPTATVGELGEQLVAHWLNSQGWVLLHHRWRCRWGEIDLIARLGEGEIQDNPFTPSSILAFIEVKTRSRGNWDAQGRLAITPSKQAKLWQTAELFLSEYPHLAHLPCRFDVALVHYRHLCQGSQPQGLNATPSSSIHANQSITVGGYQFTLVDYIPSAFD